MKEKALNILETLQAKNPDNPYYLCMIGEIRRDEELLNKVIEMTGDKYPKAHRVLGMIALEAKNNQKAFKHLKRVFELSPLAIQVNSIFRFLSPFNFRQSTIMVFVRLKLARSKMPLLHSIIVCLLIRRTTVLGIIWPPLMFNQIRKLELFKF
jgi:tetratricopeptide (TPR) repeat protein